MILWKSCISQSLCRTSRIQCSRILAHRNKYKCKKYFQVNHVIFDLDTVILNNVEFLNHAFNAVFAKYGVFFTEEWRIKILGMTGRDLWPKVVKELKINADWQNMYEDYRNEIKGSYDETPLRPGVERLVNHLEKHGIPMALVTSSTKSSLQMKTKHIQPLMSKFAHVVAGDDEHVKKSKPSGQIFSSCAYRFPGKPDPDTCLVFEGSPNGVMAASCACMQVIGVPSPPFVSVNHIAFANEVLTTLEDFWPGKYGLPPFPGQEDLLPPPNRF